MKHRDKFKSQNITKLKMLTLKQIAKNITGISKFFPTVEQAGRRIHAYFHPGDTWNPHAVYVCPKCGGDVFREEEEFGDYHPDHERIYYETWDTCENNPTECDFAERYIPDNNF